MTETAGKPSVCPEAAAASSPISPTGRERGFPWVWFLITGCITKIVMLAADFHLFPFLGDSLSYLETARTGWIPPDRSFPYGFCIRFAAALAHSLYGLLLLQTLAGIATAILTVSMLVRHFRVRPAIAFIVGLLLAVEPSQLMLERMIMAESLGTLFSTAMLACGLEAVSRGSRWAMVAAALLGVAAASLRTSLLPMAVGCMVLLPFLVLLGDARYRPGGSRHNWMRRATVYAACSTVCFVCLLGGYACLYGRLVGLPPSLNYYDGFFALAAVSGQVTLADTDDPRIAEVLARPRIGGTGPRGRNAEVFLPQGLIGQITRVYEGDSYRANAAAKSIVRRAILRDPLAIARSTGRTYCDFLKPRFMYRELQSETGYDRAISEPQPAVLASWGVGPTDADAQLTPVRRLYHASYFWFVLLLHASVLLPWALAAVYRPCRPLLLLLAVAATMVSASVLGLAIQPVARYLHPVTPILAVSLGVLPSICSSDFRRRQFQAQ